MGFAYFWLWVLVWVLGFGFLVLTVALPALNGQKIAIVKSFCHRQDSLKAV